MSTTANIMGAARQKKPLVFTSLAAIFVLMFVMVINRYHNDEYASLIYEGQTSLKSSTGLPPVDHHTSDSESSFSQNKKKEQFYTKELYKDSEFKYNRYTFTNQKVDVVQEGGENTILMLASIGDSKSYGGGKKFDDFFKMLIDLEYNKNLVSMGFLVGNEAEFNKIQNFLTSYYDNLKQFDDSNPAHAGLLKKFIRKVTLIHAPFLEDFDVSRGDRHNSDVQKRRRRNIARLRNFLLYNALDTERYTLFVDADIIEFHRADTLNYLIQSGKDIVVPRVQKGSDEDYDRNSWAGERAKPSSEELSLMDENKWNEFKFVPHDVGGKLKHIYNFYKDPENVDERNHPEYVVKLDSVGGAVLFFKSVIFKQGVMFPPTYIVGTTWDRLEGYDGVETEGVCYLAKPLGYECWGMPNLVAEHNKND